MAATPRCTSDTNRVTFVGAAPGRAIDRPARFAAGAPRAAIARGFLNDHARAFGLGDGSTLDVERSAGNSVRLQQRVDGVAVMGGEFAVNLDDQGNILSVSGEAEPVAHVAAGDAMSAFAAEHQAIAVVAKHSGVAPGRLAP